MDFPSLEIRQAEAASLTFAMGFVTGQKPLRVLRPAFRLSSST
jgi:hypothetical protein